MSAFDPLRTLPPPDKNLGFEQQESPAVVSFLPRDTRGLQGAAWVATIAIGCSGYYDLNVVQGPMHLETSHILNFVPFLLVLTGLALTYGRRSTVGWIILLPLSVLGTVLIFSTTWGETILDAGEQAARRYYAYSLTSSALLGFGFPILLVVSVVALFVDLTIKSEA
jgi:hypothetical protein